MEPSTSKEIALGLLRPIVTNVAGYTNTLEGIDIVDDESHATVGDLVKYMRQAKFKLEDKRKELVDPLNKVVKDINALFKPTRDSIVALIEDASRKMNRYAAGQQAIKDAEARVIREEAAREELEARELADRLRAAAGEEAEATAVAVVEVAEKNVAKAEEKTKLTLARGATSTTSTRQDWTAHVVDLKLLALAVGEGRLPLDCIQASQSALNKVSRESKKNREEDGVKFFSNTIAVVR